MGINSSAAKFLLYARKQNVDFSNVMMLGRQQVFIDQVGREILDSCAPGVSENIPMFGKFSEPFFKYLGAQQVDSLDYSDFEEATVIHDLNIPIAAALQSRYSLVFDGGTLEHVFNYPIAIKNCMDMIRVGGHFVSITPANNFCGHGFYQFSPELFFALFTEFHGFKIEMVALLIEPLEGGTKWYEVKDPSAFKKRVTFVNDSPTTLVVIAKKIKDTTGIALHPIQSDYAHQWAVYDSTHKNIQVVTERKWKQLYRRHVPAWIRHLVGKALRIAEDKERNLDRLGSVNPDFFRPIEF